MQAEGSEPERLELPPLRQNLGQVQQDLGCYGVALLENALEPQSLSRLARSVDGLADRERQGGIAFLEDGNMGSRGIGPNQRVFGLIGKGEEYRELALDQQAISVAKKLFGSDYGLPEEYIAQAGLDAVLLSSLTANIVGQGGVEMLKHSDQAYMPSSTSYAGVLNVVWLLTDFGSENGGTLVAPGSHLAENPLQFFIDPPEMRPICAPAGTAVFLDGRTWHATGSSKMLNKRSAIFAYYCRPFIRQQENYTATLPPELRESFSDELLKLLGFEVWFTLGGFDGASNGTILTQQILQGQT